MEWSVEWSVESSVESSVEWGMGFEMRSGLRVADCVSRRRSAAYFACLLGALRHAKLSEGAVCNTS